MLLLPGLSANLVSFEAIAPALAATGRQVISLDFRGRGLSEVTPAGSYGWPAHAADVLAVADDLGARRFSVVGWSMGAFIAMEIAARAPELLERVALIDALGYVEPGFMALLDVSLARLGKIVPTRAAYVEAVRASGIIEPWNDTWERYYEYELVDVEGGVRARTDVVAVTEDLEYGKRHAGDDLWRALSMPALLVRATRPALPGIPLVVREEDRDRFLAEKPGAIGIEVDSSHYGVGMDPATLKAIVEFLGPLPTAG